MSDNISRFLNNEGRIKIWPSKKEMKLEVLKYLSGKFEFGRFYKEQEINNIIAGWHTFNDYFLLRRGLIDGWFLSRTKNGAKYWREERTLSSDVERIILNNYDIEDIIGMSRINNGIGSNSYYILCDKGEFIFKDIEMNGMNYPEDEDIILKTLRDDGIPVPQIYKAANGQSVVCEGDKKYHMQTFVDGIIYKYNTAPEWLLYQSAELLGKIQSSMGKLPLLPRGLNQSFLDYFTPESAITNHTNTLKMAADNGDTAVVRVLEEKIKLIDRHKNLRFDFGKMTCRSTHGDYSINQIICGKDKINAVIDFTSACTHPVCWEVIRSYSLADVKCKNGEFDAENFNKYLECFFKYGSMNDYDIKIMPSFYLYQNLVCDYFNQYYRSEYKNKQILLENAIRFHKQCKILSSNIENDVHLG